MEHNDHVNLITPAVQGPGTWADLGSGRGAFTLALAELLGPEGSIFSVDRDRRALAAQEKRMRMQFPEVPVEYVQADFTRPLELPLLDGLLMANSLHFVRRKKPVLKGLVSLLKPGGRFVLVEYNTDRGNVWVPHPLSYPSWEKLAGEAGLQGTKKIGAYPSRFLREIYSALSIKPHSDQNTGL